jgi:hypothetical protein
MTAPSSADRLRTGLPASAGQAPASPWSADPLSWLTTNGLALACAFFSTTQAIILLAVPGQPGSRPVVQVLAVVLVISSFLLVHVATRPHRGPLREPIAWIALGIVVSAMGLSAFGYAGVSFRVELWWAPVASSLMLVALAPFSTARQLVRYGAAMLLITAVLAAALATRSPGEWPYFVTVLIASVHVALVAVACVVFISVVTRAYSCWHARPIRAGESCGRPGHVHEEEDESALVARVDATLSAHLASPLTFLRDVIDRGNVRPVDQQRARELAATLRTDLLAGARATWLARVVTGRLIEVDDPDSLANRLSLPQRTALRAMLDALLSHPQAGSISGRVELRSADEGAVAVAMQILSTHPEGRRTTFLAPHYVSLHANVRDIRWRTPTELEVDFEVQPQSPGARPLVQHSPAPQVRPSGAGSGEPPA